MIEIPISIEVEPRTDSSDTPADKKRKHKQQQLVTIQSVDETAISTNDSGLPKPSFSNVGYNKFQHVYMKTDFIPIQLKILGKGKFRCKATQIFDICVSWLELEITYISP